MTAAVTNPATDAMRATPGGSFTIGSVIYLDFECRRVLGEILAVVHDPKVARWCVFCQRVGQAYLAKLEVMTIGFAVGRDVNHALAVCRLGESINQFTARFQKILKGDRA